VLFPTLSALNSPPTATGECLPLCPPTPPSPSEAPAPRHFDALEVSPTAWPPPGHAPSSRTVPNTVRVSSTSNRRRTTRCGHPALLSAVRSLSDVARDVPSTNSPSPPLSPSLSLLSRSSLSSLFRVVADAVAVALVAEVAAVVPVAAAVLDRELRPQPHLRTARSNRGPRLRTQTSPPYCRRRRCPVLAVAVVVAVRVAEAADAVPAADAVAAGPRPVLSPSPSLLRSPSLPRSRNTPSAR